MKPTTEKRGDEGLGEKLLKGELHHVVHSLLAADTRATAPARQGCPRAPQAVPPRQRLLPCAASWTPARRRYQPRQVPWHRACCRRRSRARWARARMTRMHRHLRRYQHQFVRRMGRKRRHHRRPLPCPCSTPATPQSTRWDGCQPGHEHTQHRHGQRVCHVRTSAGQLLRNEWERTSLESPPGWVASNMRRHAI